MKHGNSSYIQVPTNIFNDDIFNSMTGDEVKLYLKLKELENRFTSKDTASGMHSVFFRSNNDLANDMGWSLAKLKRVKGALIKHTELLTCSVVHSVNGEKNGIEKKTRQGITMYCLK